MKSAACRIFAMLFAVLATGCQSHHDSVSAPRQNTELARVKNDAAFRLIQQGKLDEAEELLKKALAADVTYAPAMNNLGLIYYHKHVHRGEASLYDAAWWFEKALRVAPNKPEIRNNLGLVLEEAGKLREATDAYARAYDLDPDNPEIIGNLAKARIKRNLRDDETRKLLQQLIFKDTRPDWLSWARENFATIPPASHDITILPTTRPAP